MRASTLAAGIAIVVLASPAAAVALGTGDPVDRSLLDAPGQGAAAVRALGDDLDVAASHSGMDAAGLREILTSDRTAWVDGAGHLFYVEPIDPAADRSAAPETAAAGAPYSQSFLLHSRPTATRKIYLDFDGHQVHDSAWNDANHPVIDAPAYSADGSAGFSDAELDVVQEVWARVAEDYAPFNVDVTTQDPGAAGLVRSSSQDATYGMRAAITTDPNMRTVLCNGSCAGVAYVGVYDDVMTGSADQYYQPAFALPTSTYTAAQVAEIVSHEIGHTLGLSHDGLGSSPYYQDGTGTKIWSPLMGAGYTPLTQFSNGDYSGATQTQDDLAVIAQNGTTVLPDDYGNDRATAYPLGTATVGGLITTRADRDVFAVTLDCTGSLAATLTPASLGPDLDTRLRLLDASGAELAVSAPASARGGWGSPALTGMGAAITRQVAPGTYYVEVDGVGLDDPVLGYSDYGSVGTYTLAVTGCGGDPSTPTRRRPRRPPRRLPRPPRRAHRDAHRDATPPARPARPRTPSPRRRSCARSSRARPGARSRSASRGSRPPRRAVRPSRRTRCWSGRSTPPTGPSAG